MIITFFSALLVSLSLYLWQFTYCLSGYNRTFEGINVAMLQKAVTVILVEGSNNTSVTVFGRPHFSEETTKSIVNQYVSKTLPSNTLGGTYEIDYKFGEYVYYTYHYIQPTTVSITLSYSSPAYSAERTKNFRIVKGSTYEN